MNSNGKKKNQLPANAVNAELNHNGYYPCWQLLARITYCIFPLNNRSG